MFSSSYMHHIGQLHPRPNTSTVASENNTNCRFKGQNRVAETHCYSIWCMTHFLAESLLRPSETFIRIRLFIKMWCNLNFPSWESFIQISLCCFMSSFKDFGPHMTPPYVFMCHLESYKNVQIAIFVEALLMKFIAYKIRLDLNCLTLQME